MNIKLEKQILKITALALSLVLFSGEVQSCESGYETLEADSEKGFVFVVEPYEICKKCELVSIAAPSHYKKKKLMYLIFSTSVNGALKSRVYIPNLDDPTRPNFTIIIARDENTTHKLEFTYGESRCLSYLLKKQFSS